MKTMNPTRTTRHARAVPMMAVAVVILPAWIALGDDSENAHGVVVDGFTYSSSFDGTTPLYAMTLYKKESKRLPLMVVQHGYGGNRRDVEYSARRMAQRGFFSIALQIRGASGAGRQDDGGIEIMDIYDGIQAAMKKYPEQIDPSKISIVGYSNGGGNVFFATVRFPYLFRASMSFFGIPDYGMWNAGGGTYGVTAAVGGKVNEVPDKYMVRNANLAVGNLRGTRFHTVYDEGEGICPVAMQESFINAVNQTGYKDLVVHLSKAGDAHRWGHGYNGGHLDVAEDRFMDDIENITSPMPAMEPHGEFVVLGFLVTPRFTCVLGKGDDAAAKIKYEFTQDAVRFVLTPMTSDKNAKAVIAMPDDIAQRIQTVRVDGKEVELVKAESAMSGGVEGTISSTVEIALSR